MGVIADRIEPFGWVSGLIYTYPHWALDVVFYQLYNAFDFAGIYVFVLLMGILIYLLIYYTNVKVCKNHVASAIITLVSIYVLAGFIAARSQIITFLCLILEVLFIERFLETGHKRYVVGLILDPILLANCHAALFPIYFVVFLPYIAEYILVLLKRENYYSLKINLLEKKIKKLKKVNESDKNYTKKKKKLARKEEKLAKYNEKLKIVEEKKEIKRKCDKTPSKVILEYNKYSKWLILIFIICIFTGLLTPLKDIPYTYMIKSIQGNTMNFISEHQPVVLIYNVVLFAIFAVIVSLMFSNKTRIKVSSLFMLCGMCILALISYKQFPIFFICTMCIINNLIMALVKNRKEKRMKEKEYIEQKELNRQMEFYELQKPIEQIEETKKTKIRKWLVSKVKLIPQKMLTFKGMIYTVLVIVIIALSQYRIFVIQDYVDSTQYPVDAAEWINENIDKENMRLFNDFNYGSYLLFKDIPVFIDGRADVYDPKFNGKEDDSYLAYMLASSLQVWYEDVLYDYDITHLITYTNSTLNLVMEKSDKHEMIYNDGTFVIYEIHFDNEENKEEQKPAEN